MAGPIRISVLADGSQARRELGSVATSTSSLGSKLGKFGKAAGAAVAAGLLVAGAAAVKLGADSVKAASDAEQSLGATRTVFGKYADTVIKRSNEAATAIGISANQYRELSNVVGASLTGAGLSIKDATKLTGDLNQRAADMAATFGGTTKDAVEAVSSALRGETDPIERYGVSIKAADVSARLAAKGQDKLTGAALKAAEMQARLDLVFEKTSKTSGAFARESDTLAHQQQVLAAQFENVKAKIGAALLPILTALFSYLSTTALPAAQDFAAAMRDRLAPVLGTLRDLAGALLEKLTPVGDWLRSHPEIIKGIGIAFGVAAAAAGVLAIALGAIALVTSPITLTVVAIAALGAAIAYAWKNSETFREGVTAVGNALKAGLGAALDWVTAKWNEFAPLIADSLQTVTAAVKGFVGFMLPFWRNSFDTLLNVAKAVFETIKGVIEGQLKIIQGVINVIMGLIKGDWGRAWEGIKQILSGVWGIIKSIITGALDVVRAVISGALANIKDLWSAAWDAVKNVVSKAWDGIKDLVSTGVDRVVEFVRKLPGRITSAVSGAFDGLKNAFRDAINFIIDAWNGLSFHIPGFDPPGPGPKFGGITISTPDIPRLANGGITTGATLAVVGDNPGGREAIIPLDRYDLFGARSLVPLLERLIALAEAQPAAHELLSALREPADEVRALRAENQRVPDATARAMTHVLRQWA